MKGKPGTCTKIWWSGFFLIAMTVSLVRENITMCEWNKLYIFFFYGYMYKDFYFILFYYYFYNCPSGGAKCHLRCDISLARCFTNVKYIFYNKGFWSTWHTHTHTHTRKAHTHKPPEGTHTHTHWLHQSTLKKKNPLYCKIGNLAKIWKSEFLHDTKIDFWPKKNYFHKISPLANKFLNCM